MIDVDVFGSAAPGSGWATHAVQFAKALDRLARVNFRTKRKDLLREYFRTRFRPMYLRGLTRPPGAFGVTINSNTYPGQHHARWIVWETTRLPDSILEQCERASVVWTPSQWGRSVLIDNSIPQEKIFVVPEGVDTDFFTEAPSTRARGPFRFLFVGKWETRKFIDGLIQAFLQEFDAKDDVELVLHAHNQFLPDFSPSAALSNLGAAGDARIILTPPGSAEYLRDLYRSADVFVFPTRAEGWGLPILEAMACGVPAIVTDYGALVDFISDEACYRLNVRRMVDAHCPMHNLQGGQWAEPDIDHLRALMRQAFEDRDELQRKAKQARAQALRWTWDNAAEIGFSAIRAATQRGAELEREAPDRHLSEAVRAGAVNLRQTQGAGSPDRAGAVGDAAGSRRAPAETVSN